MQIWICALTYFFLSVSQHQTNYTADNAIVHSECFSSKFGFNIICRLEILKNPATSQAEGGRMYSEKVSGKQKGVKDLKSS